MFRVNLKFGFLQGSIKGEGPGMQHYKADTATRCNSRKAESPIAGM